MTSQLNTSASLSVSTTSTTLKPPFSLSDETSLTGSAIDAILPATYHNVFHETLRVRDNIEAYLTTDLNTARLDVVHDWLGLAGRQMNARGLQRQRMHNRLIVLTEQVDMHLVWFDSTIFIKPLPDYLLSQAFWKEHLCSHDHLHKSACGLLLSYSWLICHPSDFSIAQELHLIPLNLKYKGWTQLMDNITATIDSSVIDRRYYYGELRLRRLNWIYRLAPSLRFKHFVRGYHVLHHQYSSFFQRHFGWITINLFAYFALVLTAMQVGLGTNGLKDNKTFNNVSQWVAVVSIGLPLAVAVLVAMLFMFYFYNNLLAMILHQRHQKLVRQSNLKNSTTSP
jgi:hypothetical protein